MIARLMEGVETNEVFTEGVDSAGRVSQCVEDAPSG